MASGILLVPLYLRFIGVDLYGAWLATTNVLMWMTAIDPGLSAVLQQRTGFAYGSRDKDGLRELLAGGLSLAAGFAVVPLILGLVAVNYLSVWLNLPPQIDMSLLTTAFLMAVIGSCFSMFSYSVTAINQGLQSSLGIGSIYVVVHSLDIIVTVILLYLNFGILAIAFSFIFRGVGLLMGNFAYLVWRLKYEGIGFGLTFKKVPSLFKLLTVTFLARASGVFALNMDSFIVARYLGVETVPILALTRKSIDLSRAFLERPALAFMPAVSHAIGSGETAKAKQVLLRLIKILLWSLGAAMGGFIVFNDDFVRLWVGAEFFAGHEINAMLCVLLVFTVLSNSLSSLCFALGNIKGNSIALLLQSLLFIALIFLGGKYYGLVGIVIGPIISLISVSAWYYPRSFSKLLGLARTDHHGFAGESLRTIVAVIGLIFVFKKLQPTGWLEFISYTSLYIFANLAVLLLISSAFRKESITILQATKNAFRRHL